MIHIVPSEQIQHECIVEDPEVTLVHELLHVKAAETVDSNEVIHRAFCENEMWECFIEQTAQALVAAKRGKLRIR